VPPVVVTVRILFLAEKLHSDYVSDLEHQADLALRVATLDLLQGPSGNPCPSGQVFLGHLALFPAESDEFAQ
jgi:hypothetical protein